MSAKKVGVVGLGLMGYGIAVNLIKHGFDVYGYDIRPQSIDNLAAAGGNAAHSYAEIAANSDAVILMVFNAQQIRDVMFGAGGLAGSMRAGSTVIVTASVGHEILEEVDAGLKGTGIMLVDASVRASADSAASGEMYVMIGADDKAFASVKDVLDAMSSTVLRVGSRPGTAQLAKSCMQAFFSLTFEMTSEVLAIGTAAGLDPAMVYEILNGTGASNNIFRATAANIASRTFTGTNNPMSILDKDAKLAVALAHEHGMSVPALEGTSANFEACMKKHPDDDIWACVKSFEESAGIEIKFDVNAK